MATTTVLAVTAQALAARIAADAAALLDPDADAFSDFDGDYAAILASVCPTLVSLDGAIENIFRVVDGIAYDADSDDWDAVADAVAGAKEAIRRYGHNLAKAAEHALRGQEEAQQQIAAAVQQAAADTLLSPAPSPVVTTAPSADQTDRDPMSTAYVVGWLQVPEVAYVRRHAKDVTERALAADKRSDQWLYLLELRDTGSHPWKYPDHQEHADAREHVHQLHDMLIYEQMHSVDWHLLAQSLAA